MKTTLIMLSSLLLTATAELNADVAGKWSRPVNGLRTRLVMQKRVLQVGEDIELQLQIQNVGKKAITIDEPEFMPVVSQPGDHPFPENHGFNTVVTAQPIGLSICILWAKQEVLRNASLSMRLPPCGRLSVSVKVRVDPRDKLNTAEELNRGVEKLSPLRDELPQLVERDVNLRFAYGDCAGKFTLSAQYDTSDRVGGIKLETPPLEIEIRPRRFHVSKLSIEPPMVGKKCRGSFVIHNEGDDYETPPNVVGPSYGVFIYDSDSQLVFRNFGAWGPAMKHDDETTIRWNTAQNHLGATSEPPFLIRAPGQYELKVELYGSNRSQVVAAATSNFEVEDQYGAAVDGLSCGLSAEPVEVKMGDKVSFVLAQRFDAKTASKRTRLLNCGGSAVNIRLDFQHLASGKTYERRPYDIGLPSALGPKDIVRLDAMPIPGQKVLVHLLSDKGKQLPPGKYEVTATYVNDANPRVKVVVEPNGLVRQQPYKGRFEFWTGKLVSGPMAMTILPAKTKHVEIKTNSHLVVRNTPDGIGWKWGQQRPIRRRVIQRPGYIIGAKYHLHVFLNGKEVEFGGGGLGGPWHGGDGESYLPPRISERVVAGAKLTLRADMTIFETSVPVQHLWQPESGDFKVLWRKSIQGGRNRSSSSSREG